MNNGNDEQEASHDGSEGEQEQQWEAPLIDLILRILQGNDEADEGENDDDQC